MIVNNKKNPSLFSPDKTKCTECGSSFSSRKTYINQIRTLFDENKERQYQIIVSKISDFNVLKELYGTQQTDLLINEILLFLNDYLLKTGTFFYVGSGLFSFTCYVENFDIKKFDQQLTKDISGSVDFKLLFSYGIYCVTDKNIQIPSMINKATLALENAGISNDSNFAYYSEKLKQKNFMEHELISNMENGIKNGEFVFYLQPIFSLSLDNAFSAEALVRWNHPSLGLLSPVFFISLFEKTGLIYKLDKFVWESVFIYQEKRRKKGLPEIIISVNVSRKSLLNNDLPKIFAELSKKYEVPSSLIGIEITETAYHHNPTQILDIISDLKSQGFNILMDDFGTGYSSLTTLQELPIDFLKIDMQLIDKINISTKAANIMTSVVRMAIWLNIPAIAEGVEKQEQKNFLKSIGCDKIQGYFFSKPLTIENFENWEISVKNSKNIKECISDTPSEKDEKPDKIFENDSLNDYLINNTFYGMGFYELTKDNTLNLIRVNDLYYKLFNYTSDNIRFHMKNISKQIFLQDQPKFFKALNDVSNTGIRKSISIKRYTYFEKLIDIKCNISYLGLKGTNRIYAISISEIFNKTEMNQNLENILETVPCGVIQFTINKNDKTEIINMNHSAMEILNIPKGWKQHFSFANDFLNHLQDNDRKNFNSLLLKAINSGEKQSFSFEKDKKKIYTSLKITAPTDDKKTIVMSITEILD